MKKIFLLFAVISMLLLDIDSMTAQPKITEFYLYRKNFDTTGKSGVTDPYNSVDQFYYACSHIKFNDSTVQIFSVNYATLSNWVNNYLRFYKHIFFNYDGIHLIDMAGTLKENKFITLFNNRYPVVPIENDSVYKYGRYGLMSIASTTSGSYHFQYTGNS